MRVYRYAIILPILLNICVLDIVSAQKEPQDPAYIRQFPGTLTVRTFIGEKISGFSLADGAHDEKLLYRPNNVLSLGLGFTYRGIGINVSTRLPFQKSTESKYGKTQHFDLQLHHYKGKLALDAYYQRYSGYHLRDSSDVTAVTSGTDYPYFPNMQNLTIGLSGMYILNGKHYSLRAPVDQQDWQIHSAGSLLLGGSVFTHIITNNDASIIPLYLKHQDFLSGNQVKEIDNFGLTVNGGYGYNYIIHEHWFVAASADAGIGLGYSEIKDQAGTSHKVGLQVNGNARFAVGYNSNKWFSGVYIIYRVDRYDLPYAQCYMGSSEGLARFVVARRINIRKKGAS